MKILLAWAIALCPLLQSSGLAQNCADSTVGLIPLNDLGPGIYQGYQGGLYPGGSNVRPPTHDSAGLAFAAQIKPRSPSGAIDTANGRIVLLSVGMSNTTAEFSMFKSMADTHAVKNPKLAIVDGAQGGQTAAIICNPNAAFWTVIDQRLTNAGVTREQVQVAWVKEANSNPTQAFPRHAQVLDSQFVLIARILKNRYRNIRIAYWSSRIYAGYATTTLNPEPYAYENSFAVKWTIQRQIAGDTLLSYSDPNPKAPWLAWGPFLWADGMIPRSDGLIWRCTDFTPDGTHPSTNGRIKVAQLLLQFFKTDATATPWFLRASPTGIQEVNAIPLRFELLQNYPNPFNPTTTIEYSLPSLALNNAKGSPPAGRAGVGVGSNILLKVYDVLGREVATLVSEVKPPGEYRLEWNGADLPSGVYFYRLTTGDFSSTKKLLLLK